MTQAEYQRKYYQLRKARGCFDCGRPKRKTGIRCGECAHSKATEMRERYDNNKITKMKQESKAKTVAVEKIVTATKPKKGNRKKITRGKSTGDKIHKAAVSRGLAATKKTYSHKTAKSIFLRVNQLSEKAISPFALGLEEL